MPHKRLKFIDDLKRRDDARRAGEATQVQPVLLETGEHPGKAARHPGEAPERLEFEKPWNEKSFFLDTALGRTLGGHNRTGELLHIAAGVVASFTPLLKWDDVKGRFNLTNASGAALTPAQVKAAKLAITALLAIAVSAKILDADTAAALMQLLPLLGLGFIAAMAAQPEPEQKVRHGQRYRIKRPVYKLAPGQPEPQPWYTAILNGVEYHDDWDDIIQASEHVPYPRGKSKGLRNVRWIQEHISRFELVEKPPKLHELGKADDTPAAEEEVEETEIETETEK